MIDHLIAIVPAHNEEAEIIGCLTALVAAAEHAQTGEPAQADEQAQAGKAGSGAVTSRPPAVRIVAIADDCSDSTAGLIRGFAARHPLVTPMVVPFGNVGRARDAAAHAALRTIAEADPGALAATWLAFTDADSRVPVNWLTAHRDHALRGADCVVGTVEPRRTPGTGALVDAWFAGHSLGEGHEHVFGANLGIRGSLFTRIGGCPPLRLGEDAALVAAAAEAGGTIHRTDDCPPLRLGEDARPLPRRIQRLPARARGRVGLRPPRRGPGRRPSHRMRTGAPSNRLSIDSDRDWYTGGELDVSRTHAPQTELGVKPHVGTAAELGSSSDDPGDCCSCALSAHRRAEPISTRLGVSTPWGLPS